MGTSNQLAQFLTDNPDIMNVECMLVDPNGVLRGKWAPVSVLEKAFNQGINFPLSLHGCDIWGREVPETGLHIESGDRDGFCRAVPHTLARVPWGERPTAQILLQTFQDDGSRFGGCSRSVLEDVVERLADAGLHPAVAFELEFFLFKPQEEWASNQPEISDVYSDNQSSDNQRMYSLDALAENSAFFEDVRRAAGLQSLPVDTIVKEAAPGQYEINLNHRNDAMLAADDAILLRRIILECARKNRLKATFMAKPFIDQPGNGMHMHISLLDRDGENVFSGPTGRARLEGAVAGLVETMAETSLLFVNSFNGYRRMQPGSYAPTRANWGENNRSVAVRIPASGEKARRVEHRISGADANPYLALSAILCAMLEGIEQEMHPPEEEIGNSYNREGNELPSSMETALAKFCDSKFASRAIGQQMVDIIAAVKKTELEAFRREISPLELSSYL
jgi:glutamine synthetase